MSPQAYEGRAPVVSLLEMRREHVVVQEYDLSCAAAALATVLNHQHGQSLSENEVARGLIRREEYLATPELVRARQGFSLLDLKRFAATKGFEGVGYGALDLDDLRELAPVIVPVDFRGYKHFVVVRGFASGRVQLADPAFGNRTLREDAFEEAWLVDLGGLGRVGFVVLGRDGGAGDGPLRADRPVVPAAPAAALRQALPVAGNGR